MVCLLGTIYNSTKLEGENIHEFRGFSATRESFLHEMWAHVPIPTYSIP